MNASSGSEEDIQSIPDLPNANDNNLCTEIEIVDTFDAGETASSVSCCCHLNRRILIIHGDLSVTFLVVSIVGFWASIIYSYATCTVDNNNSSFFRECSVSSSEISLCQITLIVCYLAHIFSVAVCLIFLDSYKRNLLKGKNYELMEVLQIYLLKDEKCYPTWWFKFSKKIGFTFFLALLFNASTLLMASIRDWNIPRILCGLLCWSFMVVYSDFNSNTVMLRDLMLKGTHITGFPGKRK